MNYDAYLLLDSLALIIFIYLGSKLFKIRTEICNPRLYACSTILFSSFLLDLIRGILIKTGEAPYACEVLITLEYVLNGTLGYFWILYIGNLTIKRFYSKKIAYFITAILPLTYMILLVINHFNGMLYTFNSRGGLVLGKYNILAWLASSLDVLIISFISIKRVFSKEYFGNRRVYFAISTFGIWVVIFKQIEKMVNVPIFPIAIIFMVILIFVAILESIISKDSLTGINNKTSLVDHLNKLIKSKTNFYFAMIDIDDFKQVNDIYGHLEGDRAIKLLTGVLDEFPNFFVARYGGDEFCLVTTFEHMKNTKEMINGSLNEVAIKNDLPYKLKVSLGSATYHGQYKTAYDIIKVADLHLYNDKKLKNKNNQKAKD